MCEKYYKGKVVCCLVSKESKALFTGYKNFVFISKGEVFITKQATP
jgi:hypothetical protein